MNFLLPEGRRGRSRLYTQKIQKIEIKYKFYSRQIKSGMTNLLPILHLKPLTPALDDDLLAFSRQSMCPRREEGHMVRNVSVHEILPLNFQQSKIKR